MSFFLLFLRQGLGWPGTVWPILPSSLWESPCFSLLSAGIIGMYHHVQLSSKFQYCNVLFAYPISFNIVLLKGSRCSPPCVCAPPNFQVTIRIVVVSDFMVALSVWKKFSVSNNQSLNKPHGLLLYCHAQSLCRVCSSSALAALSFTAEDMEPPHLVSNF